MGLLRGGPLALRGRGRAAEHGMCECVKTDAFGARGLREFVGDADPGERDCAKQDCDHGDHFDFDAHFTALFFRPKSTFSIQYGHFKLDLQSDKDGNGELIVQNFEQYGDL
ncbi:hypothetical protein [Massilia glaciei]|uniref:hypothetical protein n=1 Tax=Massilia glaciei TaxID=1524097 RepID=UPI0015E80125|nr:hypothetical protein [Massilia glaciei]